MHDSGYELMQHAEQVQKVGWSQVEVAAIKAGDTTSLPGDAAAILDFADQAVSISQVNDATFARVQEFLSPGT